MTDSLLRLVVDAAGLSLLACLSVSLWTLRVTIAAAGRKVAAAGVAGVESLLFVLAFGTVLSSLQDPVRIAAYAVGVAGGTLLGMVVDERLSTGRSLVRLVVDGSGVEETSAGCASTAGRLPAPPRTGYTARSPSSASPWTSGRSIGRLNRDLDQIAPDAFRTVERLRDVRTTALPASMHQPHGHGARPTGR